jgi:hypothetical protein
VRILDEWKHKWFGVWREYGPAFEACPSILDFVHPEVSQRYDKGRLRNYMANAPIVASTSRSSFPDPFTGSRSCGSISFRTDGEWVWLDDLPDYIDGHDVAIPSAWLLKIQASDYVPPVAVGQDAIDKLEWPPVER